jgi:UDP-N-acetyl-D-mannosaminuronic acid dehydrogenase
MSMKKTSLDESTKKVCVVGLGYIGLPTAIVAAQAGLKVVGIDINEEAVACINRCCPVIQEPEIVQKLKTVLNTEYFYATTIYEPADFFIIAVPTPFTGDKKADLSYVFAAAASIAGVLKAGDTVILESTVPVGTTKTLGQFLASKTGLCVGQDFFVAHCPERVLPGNIFHELKINDRIIGGVDRGSTQHVAEFYKYFVSGDLYLTTAETAEMAKLIENSYRDVNIAFAHQVASMAHVAGIDPYELIDLANKHPRVNILRPTTGVGGHCVAVDPWFLVETFPEQTTLLKEARLVNDRRPLEVIATIEQKVAKWKESHATKTCRVLLLGATYKADVDDLRESPALQIIRHLIKKGEIEPFVCEPNVAKQALGHDVARYAIELQEGIEAADIIVCLVPHAPFKALDKKLLAHKKFIDFCGLLHTSHQQLISEDQFFWAASSYEEVVEREQTRMAHRVAHTRPTEKGENP